MQICPAMHNTAHTVCTVVTWSIKMMSALFTLTDDIFIYNDGDEILRNELLAFVKLYEEIPHLIAVRNSPPPTQSGSCRHLLHIHMQICTSTF